MTEWTAPSLMRRSGRWFLVGLALVLSCLAVIEVLARWNVRQERELRANREGLLYCEESGVGDPIVLLAGFQGSTRYWDRIVEPLAEHSRVLSVDALGFGRSPWPRADYRLDDHMEGLDRTLAAKNATARVTLVGYSLGAIIACHYAARHPDQVNTLVLIGTPVFDDANDGRKRIRQMSSLAALFSLHPLFARESCQLVCGLRPLARRLARRALPDLPVEVAADSVLHDWESFEGTMNHVLLGAPIKAPLAALRGSNVRIAFIHGTRDRVTDLSRLREFAQRDGARLITCKAAHREYLDTCRAEILAELVIRRGNEFRR